MVSQQGDVDWFDFWLNGHEDPDPRRPISTFVAVNSASVRLSRPVVMSENPSNHIFVDLDVERQGDLSGDSRTTPIGITLLHFDDYMDKFCARSFRAGLRSAIRRE